MPESVGNRLCKARLARGLTIDEAAHATKIRPDKILALENDDYSRFANNAYAKGFLLIYGRFLRVDVSEQIRSLEMPNDIHVAEYQYLSNAPAPSPTRMPRSSGRARKPSIAPLIAFIGLTVLAALGFYLYVTAQRLGNGDRLRKSTASETPRPSSQDALVSGSAVVASGVPTNPPAAAVPPSAAPASSPGVVSVPGPSPAAGTGTQPGTIIPAVPIGTSAPVAAQNTAPGAPIPPPAPATEVRRAEAVGSARSTPAPVAPAPTTSGAPTAAARAAAPGGVNEVTVEAVKKTWVKICRDDPNSPPIFMDYVYPKAGALKLRGARFYIESRDPAAIQIQKNGSPVAYQAPGVIVQ
jgi:cytoskeleton protein RodZ